MQNAFGEVISVGGLRKVLFDTGNEVGTGIQRASVEVEVDHFGKHGFFNFFLFFVRSI